MNIGEKGGNGLTQKILTWWQGDAHAHSRSRFDPKHRKSSHALREVLAYYDKLDLSLTCFTEHSSNPANPQMVKLGSPIIKSFMQEASDIFEINRENSFNVWAFSGVEANIILTSSDQTIIDMPDETLEHLDLTIGSRHVIRNEKDPGSIQKSLLETVMNNKIDILGHPDRNAWIDREGDQEYWRAYWEIWPHVFDVMAQNKIAFELSANTTPAPRLIDMAVKAGLKFFINLDSHYLGEYVQSGFTPQAVLNMEWLIAQLERNRVTPDRVINSNREKFVEFLILDRKAKTPNLKLLAERSGL